jgi:hypothetical protein
MRDELQSAVRWLRASYIAGAVADGVVGIMMLLPARMGETEFRLSMGLGASLMFGWTALLLWANRRPLERKGVLALTIFPVLTGLVASLIWAAGTGFFTLTRVLPSLVLCGALICLMGISYWKAAKAEKRLA